MASAWAARLQPLCPRVSRDRTTDRCDVVREQIATGVTRIALLPGDVINVYVLDDVLIDSGGILSAKRLLRLLSCEKLSAHALTHAHFDHQGSSHAICESLDIPLWCGKGDRAAVESGDQSSLFADPTALAARLAKRLGGPKHPVARCLFEGDSVRSFEVVETPGHTAGHLSYWRERDRVLIAGDVLFNRNPMSLRRGLQEAFAFATADRQASRRSLRRIADLRPLITCFGHGAPLRDPSRLSDFVDSIPI
jgi:hydroxyacylglutathione hydrolase